MTRDTVTSSRRIYLVGLHGELALGIASTRRVTAGRRCGTLDYLPPEMLGSGTARWTRTLGVLTYEFLTGDAPFDMVLL
ncbi:hypothetical protein IMZ48_50015 [Candidatus Bathyarchaeota archaeon]|nr:hypothetical protein [Candidatus Bathyarchaeota archaeon]